MGRDRVEPVCGLHGVTIAIASAALACSTLRWHWGYTCIVSCMRQRIAWPCAAVRRGGRRGWAEPGTDGGGATSGALESTSWEPGGGAREADGEMMAADGGRTATASSLSPISSMLRSSGSEEGTMSALPVLGCEKSVNAGGGRGRDRRNMWLRSRSGLTGELKTSERLVCGGGRGMLGSMFSRRSAERLLLERNSLHRLS